MTCKELDYETVIVQKLRAMEDFLNSFMAGLERPFQRKGSETSVYAEMTGRIHWYVSALQRVEYGDNLCRIYSTERLGVSADVSSRGGGILFIEPGADEGTVVSMGDSYSHNSARRVRFLPSVGPWAVGVANYR